MVDLVELNGTKFARKTLNVAKYDEDKTKTDTLLRYFNNEIEIMRKLKHDNIVNYIDSINENN